MNEKQAINIFLVLVVILSIVLKLYYIRGAEAEIIPEPVRVERKLVNDYRYTRLDLPNEASGEFKAYMDYRAIEDKLTAQWYLQQLCRTDSEGFRRFNNRYVVAVGTGYADCVGQELRVTLSSGIVFYAIVGDIKQDRHTDWSNRYAVSGNIIEFIIDTTIMDFEHIRRGDISGAGLFGAVVGLEKLK